MERLSMLEADVRAISPLNLAFVGDGVYELMVRERLVCKANRPNKILHNLAVEQVRAEAQAKAIVIMLPHLTETETAVFKRGRNAHTSRTGDDYHQATGFESLFGYLYLTGQSDRLRALFAMAMDALGENHDETEQTKGNATAG